MVLKFALEVWCACYLRAVEDDGIVISEFCNFKMSVTKTFEYITAKPIHLPGLITKAHHPAAGAVVVFSGETRNHSHGREVIYLDFEAYEQMATSMIDDLLIEAKEKWNLSIAMAQHRVGRVNVCEPAVVVITAATHRKEAYVANRYIIDKIKHTIPIWKAEYFIDGSSEWGGNCNCHKITGDLNKHVYEV